MTQRLDRALDNIAALPEDDWQPHDWSTFFAAQDVVREERGRVVKRQTEAASRRAALPKRKIRSRGLAPESAKRKAERPTRDAVRAEVIARDGNTCVAPERGLPGGCSDRPGRHVLEVHEVESRGTNPGSHLDPDKCVTLCPRHHDDCTSAVGEMLALVRRVGLVVRPST